MKAILIGATGLVGTQLLELLLGNDEFTLVKVFVRRPTGKSHPKLEEHVINFDNLTDYSTEIQGDVLFSAMGTTLSAAGSKEAQYKIDFTYQHQFAKIAAGNGVQAYVLVSSVGADSGSSLFYSKIKGELEDEVKKFGFKRLAILQPSFLDGQRKEKRLGEAIGIKMAKALSFLPFINQYKPIHVRTVAQAMLNFSLGKGEGQTTFALLDVFKLAKG